MTFLAIKFLQDIAYATDDVIRRCNGTYINTRIIEINNEFENISHFITVIIFSKVNTRGQMYIPPRALSLPEFKEIIKIYQKG